MARKRSVFFRAIQSLLKLVRLRVCGGVFGEQLYLRGLILLLLGIVLTTGIPPVLSQMPTVSPITREQLDEVLKLQNSGRYVRACETLVEALTLDSAICKDKDFTEETKDFELIINSIQKQQYSTQIIGILGNVLREIGRLEESQKFLEQGLKMAQSPEAEGDMLLSLGNTLTALGNLERDRQASPVYDYMPWRCVNSSKTEKILNNFSKFYQEAYERYQQAINKLPSSSATRIKAQLNSLNLALEMGDKSAAKALANEKINFSSLPKNRTKVYARINLAKSLTCLQQTLPGNELLWEDIINQLNEAVRDAQELKDERAKSYALGNFAGLYEYLGWLNEQSQQQKTTKNWREEALKLTKEALYLAQPSQTPDIAYRWQWQLGRLFEAQGNNQEAIANYTGAVNTLQALRKDLVVLNQDIQFSFREQVEPVYRKLVDLLLQPNGEAETSQTNLKQAREVIEALQIAELDNFFQEACLEFKEVQLENIDPKTAVVYSIVLQDRLEVILGFPNNSNKPLSHYRTDGSTQQFKNSIEILRSLIEKRRGGDSEKAQILKLSQQIYDWLLPPTAQTELETSQVNTIVFVLDGILRNIPIAALYDGQHQKYLIQNYSVALTPGLRLLPPKRLKREQIKVIAAGRKDFLSLPPIPTLQNLPNVEKELAQIAEEVSVTLLFNQEFISTKLKNEINSLAFPVVHIATHGQFSSKAEDTFIVAWDDKINVNKLAELLRVNDLSGRSDIDLLVLSACQTATGDNRATLGMAGVAVRSGARSTLATLWNVADRSTAALMAKFYHELDNSTANEVNKAEALRRAQLELLEGKQGEQFQDPYYWAAFVLVGNWL